MFEELGVFQRQAEGADAVRKEMYDFTDKGGRHVALRPEGTASVVRAFVQHQPATPWKVWYATPAFRYERAQAGRYRQHHQVGLEVLGSADPDVDVEVISLGWELLAALGLRRVEVKLNTMGTPADRLAYVGVLRAWLGEHRGDLAADDQAKVDTHPMRVLDSKRSDTRQVTAEAPAIAEHLSPESEDHFARVCDGLTARGIGFTLDPRLVRGFDYYTHTTFELVSSALEAAQSTLVGGGRYDGLIESLGGPATAGIGLGSGIERVLLACDAEGVFPASGGAVEVFVVDVAGGAAARDLTTELRRAGIGADRAFDGRSMRAQMKAADRSGARVALIVGEQEQADGTVAVRSLLDADRTQQAVPRQKVAAHLGELLS
jgi:histidyl-tRNA synthetase